MGLNPKLEAEVLRRLASEKPDGALAEMLEIVNYSNKDERFNLYHQAKRDEWAIENLREKHPGILLHITGQDIVLCVDKNNCTIFCQMNKVFQRLLKESLEARYIRCIETYALLHPGPLPDIQRHGTHWTTWLLERPELDFRNPANDPRQAISSVLHLCYGPETGHTIPKEGPHVKPHSKKGIKPWPHVQIQQEKLRHGALAIQTKILQWIFRLIEPELCQEYEAVCKEIADNRAAAGTEDYSTLRNEVDAFAMIAVLTNAHTADHIDSMDWIGGFAGLLVAGEFKGGDLFMRQLGLLIESKSGTVEFMRGRELRHSIDTYSGTRVVTVNAIPELIRKWYYTPVEERGKPMKAKPKKAKKVAKKGKSIEVEGGELVEDGGEESASDEKAEGESSDDGGEGSGAEKVESESVPKMTVSRKRKRAALSESL